MKTIESGENTMHDGCNKIIHFLLFRNLTRVIFTIILLLILVNGLFLFPTEMYKMSTTERSIEEMLEDTEDTENNVEIEHIEEIQEPIQEIETKSIQRPKRERTQKQKDALEKARETRTRNIAIKKAQNSQPPMVVSKQKKAERLYR